VGWWCELAHARKKNARAAGTSNALMEMFVELMLASVLPL